MIFSYFEFDPNCDAFTNWNGTDCVPDYDSYCEQFTDFYRQQINPENDDSIQVEVLFNGSVCVVQIQREEDVEIVEYIDSNITGEALENIQEIIKEREVIILQAGPEDLQLGERKKQVGQNLITFYVTVGIFVFLVNEYKNEQRKYNLKGSKIKFYDTEATNESRWNQNETEGNLLNTFNT